jgi:hypothetical protein
MSTVATPLPKHRLSIRPWSPALRQAAWLAGGAWLVFLIPFTLTDLTSIDRDLYYGVYVTAVAAFFGAWLRRNGSPRATLLRKWRLGLLLGLAFAGVTAAIVLREPSTPHPHGVAFAGAIVWRGVVYGAADGVILSVFPILAVFTAFGAARSRKRTAAAGALALVVSLLFTAVYHAGYSDFRSSKIRKPLVGDVIWSAPTLATLSPLGAPIAHVGLHVAAVLHSYQTDTFLPPHPAKAAPQGVSLERLPGDRPYCPARGGSQ